MESILTKNERALLNKIMGAITKEHTLADRGAYVDLMHLATAASALVALTSMVRARTDLEMREHSLRGRLQRIEELQGRQKERE